MSGGTAPPKVDAEALRAFTAEVFCRVGLDSDAAGIVAESLVWADLAGVDSHGVARIPSYIERLHKKLVNDAPRMQVDSRLPFAASLDGDNGMGALVAERAMREALERARQIGVGVVVARRSNHFGTAGYWARKAVPEGCIGICISPASKSLAPFGSKAPLFGTNPFAVAVPAGARAPWVMDLATSVAARGHIRLAVREGRTIPEGWALDRDGQPTTDAARALEGVMLPFAGPKGSALSMLADILGGVLAGAAFGGEIRDMNTDFTAPQELGHFFMAMRVDAFMPADEFAARMGQLIDRTKALPPAAGFSEVMYPGEPEARRAAARRATGVPLSAATRSALAKLAAEFDLTPLT